MPQRDSWLLPEGIEELLAEQAENLENLRRQLLDTFASWGYQLVITPFIDFLDSLLTGAGHDLDIQTFKLTDQLSGEMLGIRADMTPQVARIDAHNLNLQCPTRLCYVGTVLHTLGDTLDKSRSPMQIGAELYGYEGIESDTEVIQMMLEMLAISGLKDIHLDLGHVSIFRELSRQADFNEQQEAALFDILQRKAKTELDALLHSLSLPESLQAKFLLLPELNGSREILVKAQQVFGLENEIINNALNDLEHIADSLDRCFPDLPISFDLAELRGYHYHTGVVFAAFIPSVGKEIARGGRYNNIGEVFGRARPATGFSADLKLLSALGVNAEQQDNKQVIYAPYSEDADLAILIRDLRVKGRVVIQQFPDQIDDAQQHQCTSIIKKNDQGWVVD